MALHVPAVPGRHQPSVPLNFLTLTNVACALAHGDSAKPDAVRLVQQGRRAWRCRS